MEERVFWEDDYSGDAIDACKVSGRVKDIITTIEKLEKDGNLVVGLKVTMEGIWIIVDNSNLDGMN